MNLTKAKETKTRVCCLYRVSTKGQVDKAENDIPMQKKACHEFAESKGWTIIKEHAELGVSGFKVAAADRDELQEIKREAEKQEFDILLVFMFDRLGRKDNETPFVLKWFVEQGISVWSTVEGEQRFDSNVDDLLNYIRFWQASSESQKTSVRIKTRMKQIVEDGHYMGGTVPFGYRAVYKGRMNKKGRPVKDLEIDPREGEIVREIFFKVAREGYSAHGIARMLNERNIVTHGGARFQTNHVLRMLRHRGYTGYMIAKENTSGFIPELQIVEESIYEDAMAIVEQRKKENEQRRSVAQSSYNKTLLAGNLYCAHCGTRLSGFWHKDRYRLADGTVKEVMAPKYNCYANPDIHSAEELNRELLEEYLTYLATEAEGVNNYRADLTNLRGLLETIGKLYGYSHLESLFLTSDLPKQVQPKLKSYSDSELIRFNAALAELDEQIERLMVIHQMLGTRISDTLTLQTDCLYRQDGHPMIQIRQMKTTTFVKPISAELELLIEKAMEYTKKRYGDTLYIFVDEKNTKRPLQYNTVQNKVMDLIQKKDLRDDKGELFGFGTHMFRHVYGIRLTELHLDDWTIAKLLGHTSVKNVKFYRKMSLQIIADETREIRAEMSRMIRANLAGWGKEYEQI